MDQRVLSRGDWTRLPHVVSNGLLSLTDHHVQGRAGTIVVHMIVVLHGCHECSLRRVELVQLAGSTIRDWRLLLCTQ